MRVARVRLVFLSLMFAWSFGTLSPSQTEPDLTPGQQREFLLNAEVIRYKQINKGVTSPYRLTLSDGKITHDAAFQSIDDRRASMRFPDGHTEINFVDSYKYNIAAYELSDLLGLADMMPVTVLRVWKGKSGAISWWLPHMMDEGERIHNNITPPDPDAWNRQMHKVRVFSELVYDTDRNLGNVLIGKDWQVYMIDFSRAFRLYHDINQPKNLVRCSRDLLEHLRKLDGEEFAARAKAVLYENEVEAVMLRRDKIVAHFEQLIAEKGEDAVLY
jgi:hypothetical protein